jgi:ferredoxin/flavodoxin---NADP+ reductase
VAGEDERVGAPTGHDREHGITVEQEMDESRAERRLGSTEAPLRVAIIGSGPSGFYAAEYLQRREDVAVEVDMFDRLPTPFGLVRGGVAPDHQKIKSVTRVYDRIARHPEFRFYGNVEIGRELTHEDLAAYYHVVIYAVGARSDRRLGIIREHLPGSHAAAEFVGWYNGHPDFRRLSFDFSSESAVIVGNGNVAMDLARILASRPEALAATDMADHALSALSTSRIREISILGRRGPAQAAFTPKELRELGELEGVDVEVDAAELELDPLTAEWVATHPDRNRDTNLDVLRDLAQRPLAGHPRRITFRFMVSPIEIAGHERVEGLVVVHNELYRADDGTVRSRPTGQLETLPVRLVFRAIGYIGTPIPGVNFDAEGGVIPNAAGRVLDPSGAVVPGEYAVGWIKRGPTGIIGANKPDANETVSALFEDFDAGRLAKPQVPPRVVLERLLSERSDFVSYEDWQLLDQIEQERGARIGSRPRQKFTSVEQMLHALAEAKGSDATG